MFGFLTQSVSTNSTIILFVKSRKLVLLVPKIVDDKKLAGEPEMMKSFLKNFHSNLHLEQSQVVLVKFDLWELIQCKLLISR